MISQKIFIVMFYEVLKSSLSNIKKFSEVTKTTKMVRAVEFNEEVTKHSVHTLVFRSLKRTHDMFVSDHGSLPDVDDEAEQVLRSVKSRAMYGEVKQRVDQVRRQGGGETPAAPADSVQESGAVQLYQPPDMMAGAARVGNNTSSSSAMSIISGGASAGSQSSTQVAIRKAASMPKPSWHAPWKLYRVISGKKYFYQNCVYMMFVRSHGLGEVLYSGAGQ